MQSERTNKIIESIRKSDLNASGMLSWTLKKNEGDCLSESELVEAGKMLKMNPRAGAGFISAKTRTFLLNLAKNDPTAAAVKAKEFGVDLNELAGMKAAYTPHAAATPESGVIETEADVLAAAARLRGDYIPPVMDSSQLSTDGIMKTEADVLNFVKKFKEGRI